MRKAVLVALALQLSCGDADKIEKLEKKIEELHDDVADERKKRRTAERKYEDAVAEHEAAVKRLKREVDDQRRLAEAARRPPPVAPRPARVEPDPMNVYAIQVDQSIIEGPADAKVTLVWAYDYACRWCEKSRATIADLRKKYGADLRVAYTQLLIHPATATAPAHAACAAAKQGGFARLDPLLWDKSFLVKKHDEGRCWEGAKGCPVMTELAREAGLDPVRLVRDMPSCTTAVDEQTRRWRDFAVSGTPAFFVNGRYVGGGYKPASGFERLIDEELAKASARIAAGTPKAEYYKRHVLDVGLMRVDPTPPRDPYASPRPYP